MMKNYKLLLLALLSIAAPVCAMDQEGGRTLDAQTQSKVVDAIIKRFGAENAIIIAKAFKENDGVALGFLPSEMIYCNKCKENHKRPEIVVINKNVQVNETHVCFSVAVEKGEINPTITFRMPPIEELLSSLDEERAIVV